MCGIVGAFDLRGRREFPRDRLAAMTRALAHRGPDDEQLWLEPGLALGVRRLAIVDPSGGRQPLADPSGEIRVAFNGEVFNHLDLRATLEERGLHFRTRCDTEVWAHLYREHGRRLLERVRGQFAVSIWDRRKRLLLLARDRFGICPLHYCESDGWLLWASEIRALLASGLIEARPDHRAIDYFFTFFCAPEGRTFFAGVRTLVPGALLTAADAGVDVRAYWQLEFPHRGDERREREPLVLIEELEHLLRESVRRRLGGDVPVVSYLSGGVDSTLVLALAREQASEPLPSFSIGLIDAGRDEGQEASVSAASLGSPSTLVRMNRAQIAELLPRVVLAAEAPVLDTTCACILRLAEEVNGRGFKVALTGEGADEAFAGYPWMKLRKLRDGLGETLGDLASRLFRRAILASVGGGSAHRLDHGAVRGVRIAPQSLYDLPAQSRETLYSAEMWSRLEEGSPFDDLPAAPSEFERWHPVNRSLWASYKIMLPGLLLHAKGDRPAMRSSVETRPPFLDEEVVSFAAALAPEYKLRGWTEKWLLRKVAERHLPPVAAWRRKVGFHGTLSRCFLEQGRPSWVDDLLSPESLAKTGYFDPSAVARQRELQARRRWVDDRSFVGFSPRSAAFDMGLTCVIATQLWHHLFCGGGLARLDRAPAATA